MLIEEVSKEKIEEQEKRCREKIIESQLFEIFKSCKIPMTYRFLFKEEPRFYAFYGLNKTVGIWDNHPKSHVVAEIQLDKKTIKVFEEMFYAPMKIWGKEHNYDKIIKCWSEAN